MTRLFIGKVSKKITKALLESKLRAIGDYANLVIINKPHKSFMYVFFEVEYEDIASKFLLKPILMKGKEHYVQVSHKSQAQDSSLNFHKVFLSNIPVKLTDSELRNFFNTNFGEVISAFSIKNDRGHSKGYGFLDFKHQKDAEEVISAKKILFKGKIIIAKKFQQKGKRGQNSQN
jgi:RNA recognition motif-containing protein